MKLEQAIIDAKLALANWTKYNGDQADEVVYQAEKLATALGKMLAALSSPKAVPCHDEKRDTFCADCGWVKGTWIGENKPVKAVPVEELRWQPIETAPKDGSEFIGMDAKGNVERCFWWEPSSRTRNWLRRRRDGGPVRWSPTEWTPMPPFANP